MTNISTGVNTPFTRSHLLSKKFFLALFFLLSHHVAFSDIQSSSCGAPIICDAERMIVEEHYIRNPERFNVMRALKSGDTSLARDIMEGYQDYSSPYRMDPSIGDLISVGGSLLSKRPGRAFSTRLMTALTDSSTSPDGDRRPLFINPRQYLNPSVDPNVGNAPELAEYRRKLLAVERNPEIGRTDDQFRKWFGTPEGSKQKSDVGSFEVDLMTYASLPEDAAKRRPDQLAYLQKTYNLTQEEIEEAAQVATEQLSRDRDSVLLVHRQKALAAFRNRYEEELEKLQQEQEELEQYRARDNATEWGVMQREASIENQKQLITDSIESTAESDGLELSRLLDEEGAGTSDADQEGEDPEPEKTPVYFNGQQLYSDASDGLVTYGTGGKLGGNVIRLMSGDEEAAARLTAFTEGIVYSADGFFYLSKNGFDGDPSKVLGAMNGVALGINIAVAVFSSTQEDPMAEAFQQLFERIAQILDNQKESLENQKVLLATQGTILYAAGSIRDAIASLNRRQLAQNSLLLEQFSLTRAQIGASYLDIQERIERLRADYQLDFLYSAMSDLETLSYLSTNDSSIENDVRRLIKGVSRLSRPLSQIAKDPPAANYQQLLDEMNGRVPRTTAINDLRVHYARILKPLCTEVESCAAFNSVPDAVTLQTIANTYARASALLSLHPEGREFLKGDIDRTFRLLDDAIASLEAASSLARKKLPKAYERYIHSVQAAEGLLFQYGQLATLAIGGKAEDRPWPTLRWLRGPFDLSQEHLASLLLQIYPEGVVNPPKHYLDQLTDRELQDHEAFIEQRSLSQSSLVAANLKLGSFSPKVWFRNDYQFPPGPGEPPYALKRAVYHDFFMQNPLIVENEDRARLEFLMKQAGGDSELFTRVIDKGRIRQVLGGHGYASIKVDLEETTGPPPDNEFCYHWKDFMGRHHLCMTGVTHQWISTSPKQVLPTAEHYANVHHYRGDQDTSWYRPFVEDDPEFIRKQLQQELSDMSQLRFLAIDLAAKEIVAELMEQWNVAAQKGDPKFEDLVSMIDKNHLKAVADQLPEAINRLAESRLAYTVALELGYGEDCLSSRAAPTLQLQSQLLRSGYFLTASALEPKSDQLFEDLREPLSKVKTTLLISSSLNSNYTESFPAAKNLSFVCGVGMGFADRLSQFRKIYRAWVKEGATLDTIPREVWESIPPSKLGFSVR